MSVNTTGRRNPDRNPKITPNSHIVGIGTPDRETKNFSILSPKKTPAMVAARPPKKLARIGHTKKVAALKMNSCISKM